MFETGGLLSFAIGLLEAGLTVVALILALASLFFLLQVGVATRTKRPKETGNQERPSIAVLVPAHNEAKVIRTTLAQAKEQLFSTDRLLVVADNCSDDTAVVAAGCNAEVVVRFNTEQRGKGYALAYGIQHLMMSPRDVVIVLDADCTLDKNCLELIAKNAISHRRPVQARYLMTASGDSLKAKVTQFAMRIKNWVRPRGMHGMGLPCGLYGTGMAFPWEVAVKAPFSSGHLAEDMQLGIQLAEQGFAPLFCEEAHVNSVFPENSEGEKSQRTRWEHGHLSLILNEGPKLLASALMRGRWRQIAQLVDMLIPPLVLFTLLQCLTLGISAVWYLIAGGALLALILAFSGLMAIGVAIALSQAVFARDLLSVRDMLGIPAYVIGKLSIYVGFAFRRQVEWVRTKRDEKP